MYKTIHYLTCDNNYVAQYPLHHLIYAATKFEVVLSYGLGGDTFTRNVTEESTDVLAERAF